MSKTIDSDNFPIDKSSILKEGSQLFSGKGMPLSPNTNTDNWSNFVYIQQTSG